MDTKRHQSYPLRLSPSIREQCTLLAREQGISLNYFISLAMTEKIVRMEQEAILRQKRIDLRLARSA